MKKKITRCWAKFSLKSDKWDWLTLEFRKSTISKNVLIDFLIFFGKIWSGILKIDLEAIPTGSSGIKRRYDESTSGERQDANNSGIELCLIRESPSIFGRRIMCDLGQIYKLRQTLNLWYW